MAKNTIPRGSTSVIRHIFIQDSSSTTGAGLTGLTSASSGLSAYYIYAGGTAASLTLEDISSLGTYAAPTSNAYIRFKKIDDTNMPGWYEIQMHNDWFSVANARKTACLQLKGATNMAQMNIEFDVIGFDIQDADPPVDVTKIGGTTQTAADLVSSIYNGNVWCKSGGSAGTTWGTNGTPKNMTDIDSAVTLSATYGLPIFHTGTTGSTFGANANGVEISSPNAILTMGGFTFNSTVFKNCLAGITGVNGTGALNTTRYENCRLYTATFNSCVFERCRFENVISFDATGSSTSIHHSIFRTNEFNFGTTNPGVMTLNIYNSSGSFTLKNVGAISSDTVNIYDGGGTITFDSSCTGGTVNIYGGDWSFTDPTTGVTVNEYPANIIQDIDDEVDYIHSVVDSIAVTGSALNKEASSSTLTTGSEAGGAYTDTALANGNTHDTSDATGVIDRYYVHNIGTTGSPAKVSCIGRLQQSAPATGNSINLYVYNWVTDPTGVNNTTAWDLLHSAVFAPTTGTINTIHTEDVVARHVSSSGDVRVRFYNTGLKSGGSTLKVDQVLVEYAESTSALISAIKTKTDYLPSATAGAANGLHILGTNAGATTYSNLMTYSEGVAVTKTSGNAVNISTTDGHGIAISATGTGKDAINLTAATGHCIYGTINSATYPVVRLDQNGTGHGVRIDSGGGSALYLDGNDGYGINIPSRYGITMTGRDGITISSTNYGVSISVDGSTGGAGLLISNTNNTSGPAVKLESNYQTIYMASGTNGVEVVTTNGHGVTVEANGSGKDALRLDGASEDLNFVNDTSSLHTNQTTMLNRLGAWTGTGLNTILGAFRAIAGKTAALTPSDITDAATTFDNTTDSLEATRDAVTSASNDIDALVSASVILSGTVGAAVATSTTIDLGASASASADMYNGCMVLKISVGLPVEARYIKDYAATTKIATIPANRPWINNPIASTDTYIVIPGRSLGIAKINDVEI